MLNVRREPTVQGVLSDDYAWMQIQLSFTKHRPTTTRSSAQTVKPITTLQQSHHLSNAVLHRSDDEINLIISRRSHDDIPMTTTIMFAHERRLLLFSFFLAAVDSENAQVLAGPLVRTSIPPMADPDQSMGRFFLATFFGAVAAFARGRLPAVYGERERVVAVVVVVL